MTVIPLAEVTRLRDVTESKKRVKRGGRFELDRLRLC